MNIYKLKTKGFTLAEVLITLAVIGVLAAMSIPSLINNANKAKYVASVQKAQSTLSSAIQKYMTDNSCMGNLSACMLFDQGAQSAANTQKVWDEIKTYFNITKDCGTTANLSCFTPGIEYLLLNGKYRNHVDLQFDTNATDTALAKGILADGMSIGLQDYGGNCASNRSVTGTGFLSTVCAYFVIDINGHKKPNQLGRDTFLWRVANNGMVFPSGTSGVIFYADANGEPNCDPTNNSTGYSDPGYGFGCTAKIIKESAMNY